MSTKIYNAYKWNGHITDLMSHLQYLTIIYRNNVVNRFFEMIYYSDIKWDYQKIKNFITDINNSGLRVYGNTKLDVMVYFHKNDIYLQFFGLETIDIPLDDKRLIDFSYWNNSDPPDDIDDDEFESRYIIWNEIIGDKWTPEEYGLLYEFSSSTTINNIIYDLLKKIHYQHKLIHRNFEKEDK